MSAISHIFSEKPLTCIDTFPQVNFWETHREKGPFRFDQQGAQFGMVGPSPPPNCHENWRLDGGAVR